VKRKFSISKVHTKSLVSYEMQPKRLAKVCELCIQSQDSITQCIQQWTTAWSTHNTLAYNK